MLADIDIPVLGLYEARFKPQIYAWLFQWDWIENGLILKEKMGFGSVWVLGTSFSAYEFANLSAGNLKAQNKADDLFQ